MAYGVHSSYNLFSIDGYIIGVHNLYEYLQMTNHEVTHNDIMIFVATTSRIIVQKLSYAPSVLDYKTF